MAEGSAVWAGACAIAIALCANLLLYPGALASIALFGGYDPSVGGGLLTLGFAALQTMLLTGLSLVTAFSAATIVNALAFSHERLAKLFLVLSLVLAAAPLFALIPVWLSFTGDGWLPGFGFLTASIFVYLLISSIQSLLTAAQVRKLLFLSRLRGGPRRRIILEYLWWSARGRLVATLAFSIPFSVGAELIADRGGLGDLATAAYRNGDFGQLLLIATLYACFSLALAGWTSAKPGEEQAKA